MIDVMPTFTTPDGTTLAYHLNGSGNPLICLPGGPIQDSAYLGDLGGLSEHRQLVLLDTRGTGESANPTDAGSYRCDRLVDDVEALRLHLGLESIDLLAHSAGANLATLYAARFPDRVGRLVLVTPSTMAVGIAVTGEDRLALAKQRSTESWYPAASAALESIVAGNGGDADWAAVDPFFYGRWDAAAKAHHSAQDGHRNPDGASVFAADGAFDPDATRSALAEFTSPVLVIAGEVDLNSVPTGVAQFAELFPNAELVIQPGAGHFPWVDDSARFVAASAAFLG